MEPIRAMSVAAELTDSGTANTYDIAVLAPASLAIRLLESRPYPGISLRA